MEVCAVYNPASGGGKTGREWRTTLEPLLREQFGAVRALPTEAAGHATDLTRQALKEGAELILAVGGDGTLNEVANGFLDGDALIETSACLSPLPSGTGGDFCRTLNMPRDPKGAIAAIANGTPRPCDLGLISFNGRADSRAFINIADLGVGGALVERLNRTGAPFGGFIAYLWNLLVTLGTFSGEDARVTVDGDELFSGAVHSVVVANGQYFGSGMHIAPKAAIDSGQFEVIVIEYGGLGETLRNIPRMYKGALEGLDRVHYRRGGAVEVEASARLKLDCDGEYVGDAPARFRVLPGALRVRA